MRVFWKLDIQDEAWPIRIFGIVENSLRDGGDSIVLAVHESREDCGMFQLTEFCELDLDDEATALLVQLFV